MSLILAVDPGTHCAIAIYCPANKSLPLVSLHHLPDDLPNILPSITPYISQLSLIVIEAVHSMPNQGVSSTFTFGRAYGLIQGLLTSLNKPILLISPSEWKPRMRLSSDKKLSLRLANQLFPSTNHFRLVKHHDKAEAALLAVYTSLFRGS